MAPSFRRAIRSDIPQMHVVRLAVRENPLTSYAIQECHYIPQIEATGRGWVAQVNGEIVGFAIGNAKTGNIWALFVHPDYERLGIGQKLHNMMTDWLFSKGLPSLNLGTAIGTQAQSFYERAGWRFVGERGGEALYVLSKERHA